ncbi:hypothetical protein DYU11_20665 [Fibrisoma montanum]|uniref:Ig-like domain-containing protein n=1 Tax=Fibrisoma montanum TaxID=2305895 RepID=A0A418M3V6_9BACT|nr:hypothetical protein [Fibrisoma montanum]RIV20462.1 hypothetical protein DYU11_20665 [Fibrisoma montanum]
MRFLSLPIQRIRRYAMLSLTTLMAVSLSAASDPPANTPPGKYASKPYVSLLRSPGNPLIRIPLAANDPIRFSLTVNKPTVRLGEEVELTITAELLNVSPNLMFFFPGSNAFSLKLLLPPGFQQTGGTYVDYVGDELTYPAKPTVTYRLKGHFTSVTAGSGFRLLRSQRQAGDQSQFVEKARLQTEPFTGSQPLPRRQPAVLYVLTPSEGSSANARTAASNVSYRGFFEFAHCDIIGGWAMNDNARRRSTSVDIFIDNQKVATVPADQIRQDVADAFDVRDYNRYGFRWEMPAKYRNNRAMRISARFSGTDTELTLSPRTTDVCQGSGPVTPPVSPPETETPVTPPANARYRGFLDWASCERITGWVMNEGTRNQSASIDIFINDQKAATILADQQRPDVAAAFGVKGFDKFGYNWTIPDRYKRNGRLTITVKGAGSTQELTNSPRTTAVCESTTPVQDSCRFMVAASSVTATCGSAVTLTAACQGEDCNAVSYTWTGNGITKTGASISVDAPSTNGAYSYTVTASRPGCATQTAVSTVTVNGCVTTPPPVRDSCRFTVSASSVTATCGSTVTLTAACQGEDCNAVSYAWSGNGVNKTGSTVSIDAPSTNGTYSYTVTASRSGCATQTAVSSVTVSGCVTTPPPVRDSCRFTVAASSVTATCGSAVTLTAACQGEDCGAVTYNWTGNGITKTGASISVDAPSTNGAYSYTVTASRPGCATQTAVSTVTVSGCVTTPPPVRDSCRFTVSASSVTATCGSAVTLTAACQGEDCNAVSYAWAGNGVNKTGSVINFNAPLADGTYFYTVTATRNGCATKTDTATISVNGCTPPSNEEYPILNSPYPADKRPVLQNERVRVAIDLGVGGVIREVTDLEVGENMINCMVKSDGVRDPGRDDQISLYSLPGDNTGWKQGKGPLLQDIGYNPVQGGDLAGNFSPILGYGRTDKMLYSKTRGLHWGLNNELGDYIVEQWIRLDGNIVRRHVRITGDRKDETRYSDARQQELPCTYTNSAYYQYYVVQADPYTNGELINVNALSNIGGTQESLSQHNNRPVSGPYDIDASEPWIVAVRPSNNRGLALHTPFSHEFRAGLFGEIGWGPAESSNAGYIANGITMILDRNGVYEFDINMVVGTLPEIRSIINTLPRSETKPNYVFAGQGKRHGFFYRKGYDQGYPVGDELIVTPTDKRFRINSPTKGYRTSEFKTVYVRMRARTRETQMVFDWRKVGQTELQAAQAGQQVTFTITGDNQYRTIAIPVGNHPEWNGTIAEFGIKYVNPTETPVYNQEFGIKWLSADNLGNE